MGKKGISQVTQVTKTSYTKEELQPIIARIMRDQENNNEALEIEMEMAKSDIQHRHEDERAQDAGFARISSGQGTVTAGESINVLTQKRDLIEAALGRIHAGTYGIDSETGGLIPLERLKASPYSTKTTKPGMRRQLTGKEVLSEAVA